MAKQLSFPLPRLEARGRAAFYVSGANALAVRQVEGWRDWPRGKLLLIGPEGSGKSHLAAVWAGMAGAGTVAAGDLAAADLPALAAAPLAVEDACRVAGDPAAERALFHLHNLMAEGGRALLLTARTPPRRWGLGLPDLASRMEGTALATLEALDDPLLAALLVKLFADRQIAPPPRLIDFCLKRMERSFAAAQRLVAALDARSLAEGRPIGTQLAGEILDDGAA
jgi:chromosomal replication initiation ATPase DnaA